MINDLRFALRTLLKNPGFTTVAIATLALGIGANTAIFSVVNSVLLRPLPYPNAASIVQFYTTSAAEPKNSHTPGDFMDFSRGQRTLAALAGYREDAITLAPSGGEPVRTTGALVTVDYFDVFGTPPAAGRTFTEADASGSEPLAVISETIWKEQFAGDAGVVGRRARFNGVPHTVVGIMPGSFDYPAGARIWLLSPKPVPRPPLDIAGELLESRDVRYFQAVGRLAPGVSIEQATSDLRIISDDIGRRFQESSAGRGVLLEPLHERIVGQVRNALLFLLAAVGVVLLIACANVSSLLLARASGRQREMALRAALGASRGRILRQLFTESLVLGVAGGAAGLIVGSWAVGLLVSIVPEGTPRADEIGLDAKVATIAILLSCGSAMLFGLVPAWQGSATEASAVLREAGDRGSTGGRRRSRTRAVLVVAEVALTLILLVAAGLLANSFLRLQRVDPGFDPEEVTLVNLPLPQSKYTDGKQQAAFYKQVVEGMRQRKEIASAAVLFPSPLQGNNASGGFSIDGRETQAARADRPVASIASISPDYFKTMGIPLIQGRDFTERDREPQPPVAIVNATLARRYLAGVNPIGARVRFSESGDDWITVVGIAGDSLNVGLNAPPNPIIYLPYHTFPLPFMGIVARSSAGAGAVASVVREQVKVVDPELPVDRPLPLAEVLRDSVAEPRFRTLLLVGFALMALLLAAVGLYGLISYSVTQRTREIGIRMALGARPDQVMLPVLREGLALAAAGVALGLVGSLAVTRLLRSFLFGVEATDPLTYTTVAILLLGIALLASYIPARRALTVDPVTALRSE